MMDWDDVKPPKRARTSMSSSLSSRKGDEGEETFFDKFCGELWQICPIDKTHYAKRKNMDDHIEECKKKCLKSVKKVECPFNPLHIINRMEVEHHIMVCPNRVTIVNGLCDFEPKRETIEGVAMEPVNVMPEIPTYWDDDVHPEGTYDPMDSTKFRDVIRTMPTGLSKSQKKAWKQKERQRMQWLKGPTREKPVESPAEPAKEEPKTEVAIKKEASMMQSIIDGLDGANIADPRDAMLKRINARLKALQMMEAKLREEKLELQRQVEIYLASIAKPDIKPALNGDPRGAPKPSTSNDRRTENEDHASRILPDIMTSAMIR